VTVKTGTKKQHSEFGQALRVKIYPVMEVIRLINPVETGVGNQALEAQVTSTGR